MEVLCGCLSGHVILELKNLWSYTDELIWSYIYSKDMDTRTSGNTETWWGSSTYWFQSVLEMSVIARVYLEF